ncbi:NAD-dependent epimerase/dehydratase family protein [Zobellia galactanivorans]|uniref:NAD-dependent epimerase/dehydratase family protein n=1 Tax=Zobellia galactanivorans (strain DSM 12802 / CCUG 47099 / CIP 106680 / NCIMB 13871 / Dsij) TaxID=63186 RepID=UPI001C066AB0|nr:NAD-dependent epimerase/dehydratase family protein [Zobellia galactanivorans]MBU3025087.1 NAD-dependent epimerase/dehydratase family protein [Zobellia galactanivorans]
MSKQKILVTGANGQLGTVLSKALIERYGNDSVITSDLRDKANSPNVHEILDATDTAGLKRVITTHGITEIYHLAAVLSAKGEEDPIRTWEINLKSLLSVLSVAAEHMLNKVFFPSSIAVYGGDIRKWDTPQDAPLNPSTVYGISKAAGENWANYYFTKYGLDVRSLRYPGIIGHESLPGGGTTDYAVDIFHKAVQGQKFDCYLHEDATLPMIYMDDAIRATIELMEAPKNCISIRTSYNLQAASFRPKDVAKAIRKFYPDFQIDYKPDFRQDIAASWPYSLDDSKAREDWKWRPQFQLKDIVAEMISELSKQYTKQGYKTCTTI